MFVFKTKDGYFVNVTEAVNGCLSGIHKIVFETLEDKRAKIKLLEENVNYEGILNVEKEKKKESGSSMILLHSQKINTKRKTDGYYSHC